MLFKSPILSQASGALAGNVFAHNKGGMYMRARATPVNPATPQQVAVRNAVKTLSTRWLQVLTQVQRDAWTTYAVNVPLTNKLGEPHIIPALAMYIRCNSPRLINAGIASVVDDGPTVFALATFTAPTIVTIPGDIQVTFTNTDDWAIADGGHLYVYQSRPQNVTINFFKGPFRYTGEVDGVTLTPPTSPQVMTPVFPVGGVNRWYFRAIVSNADGRLSSPIISFYDDI